MFLFLWMEQCRANYPLSIVMRKLSVSLFKERPHLIGQLNNSEKHSQNVNEMFNLNTALMEDGAIININNNKGVAITIYIIHVGNNDGFYNYRHMINVQNGAHVNIIEFKISNKVDIEALYTSSIIWKIGDNCVVNNVKYQAHNQITIGFNQQYADIANDTEFNSFTISSGSKYCVNSGILIATGRIVISLFLELTFSMVIVILIPCCLLSIKHLIQ